MSAECLRPQAERALRRTAARRVKRDEWIKQERHVVATWINISFIHVHHIRQGVEVVYGWTIRIVDDFSVRAAVGDPKDLVQRLAVGKLDRGVVELAPHHKIEG